MHKTNNTIQVSIENIIDYVLMNCDIENVKGDFNKTDDGLCGIQMELRADNPVEHIQVDISLEKHKKKNI